MNRSTQHAFEPEEVMAYLDGELDPARAAALAGHLDRCDECRAVATEFRQLSEKLSDFQVESSPAGMSAAVLANLGSSEPRKKSVSPEVDEVIWTKLRRAFRSPVVWALAATAVITLIVVGVHGLSKPAGISGLVEPVELSASQNSAAPADSVERSGTIANMKKAEQVAPPPPPLPSGAGEGEIEAPTPAGPMIAQTAGLTIVAANYDQASAAVDRLAASQGGYVQKLATSDQIAASREFSATVRVPTAQLGGFLAELRKLGHVEQETRTNEEVTDQYVDLQARLKSARASEQRMLELLSTRTGKLEDVLDAERELARIREEIESMEGQRILLAHRVNYATVDIQLREEYQEQLHPGASSTTTGLRNSLVEGLRNLEDGVVGLLVFLLAYGPSILFWCALLAVPGFFIWRRVRSRSGG